MRLIFYFLSALMFIGIGGCAACSPLIAKPWNQDQCTTSSEKIATGKPCPPKEENPNF